MGTASFLTDQEAKLHETQTFKAASTSIVINQTKEPSLEASQESWLVFVLKNISELVLTLKTCYKPCTKVFGKRAMM